MCMLFLRCLRNLRPSTQLAATDLEPVSDHCEEHDAVPSYSPGTEDEPTSGPVTAQVGDLLRKHGDSIPNSWSANFEVEPYVNCPDLIIEEAVLAIRATHVRDDRHYTFVNLITPGTLGDPGGYLVPALKGVFGDTLSIEDAGQCECGGFVTRVWRNHRKPGVA